MESELKGISQSDLFRYKRMLARAGTELGQFKYSTYVLEELKVRQGGLGDNDIEKIRTNIEYGMLLTKCGNYRDGQSYLEMAYKYLDDKNVPDLVYCLTTLAQFTILPLVPFVMKTGICSRGREVR